MHLSLPFSHISSNILKISIKVILLLNGSIQSIKNNVNRFLESFGKYSWLWNKNPNDELKIFSKGNPQLEDYEEKLKEFDEFMDQVSL